MNGARAKKPVVSERDRRFALLVAMLAPDPRRTAGRRSRLAYEREKPMDRDQQAFDEQPVVTAANKDRVRAGVTGHNVRYVLIVSVALVIVAFLAIAAFMWR